MNPQSITVQFPKLHLNKVAVIKAVRALTGYGLKEAKDVSEIIDQPVVLKINPGAAGSLQSYVDEQIRVMISCGCEVRGSAAGIVEDLRKLGIAALEAGEDDLANDILQLVLAEKLRRKDQ